MDCSSPEFVDVTQKLVQKIAVLKEEVKQLEIDLVITVSKNGQVLFFHDDGIVEVTDNNEVTKSKSARSVSLPIGHCYKIPGRC